MPIRRVLCLQCRCTHAVLPAFLLGRIRYGAQTLAPYLESAKPTEVWQQNQSNGPEDLSTLYRWLRRLRGQLTTLLPLLQQTLMELVPDTGLEPYRDPALSFNSYQLALWLARQILAASENLLQSGNTAGPQLSPAAFLNYLCWQKTGRPLLSPPSKLPP